jgi:hypothetical protein
MDRDCTQHNLDMTESTSSSNENFEIYDIGEAVAFDENDQVVSPGSR